MKQLKNADNVDIKNILRNSEKRYRIQEILKYVAGKKVLDLGCVQHSSNKATRADWLHGIISKYASYCLGVDLLEKEVKKLNELGYNIICADVEKMDLPEKDFDVIVAGELIEHLANPGLFLENCRNHLKDDGLLIITTPNPFCFIHFRRSILCIVPKNLTLNTLKQLMGYGRLTEKKVRYIVRHKR